MFPIIAEQINQLLPQTQCQECGFSGCLPYAQALAQGNTPANLCSAGGEIVAQDLANLLGVAYQQPEKIQPRVLAWIDESVCIGCTACIRACPVDAIMGASKYMHTVLADECTGCGLCVAPCPVDCIYLQEVGDEFLPRHRYLAHENNTQPRFQAAQHAQARYDWHTTRKARDDAERRAKIAEREAATKAAQQTTTPAAFNPADLIAQAMKKAQSQQEQRVTATNREDFRAEQIRKAQEKATYSRAMLKLNYGNETEKAEALAWLRQYKIEQEEKNSGSLKDCASSGIARPAK